MMDSKAYNWDKCAMSEQEWLDLCARLPGLRAAAYGATPPTLSVGDKVRLTEAAIDYILAKDSNVLRGGESAFTKAVARYGREGTTATVQKVFKNGKVAVAVDFYRNTSEDGRKTMNYPASWLKLA